MLNQYVNTMYIKIYCGDKDKLYNSSVLFFVIPIFQLLVQDNDNDDG